MEITVPMERRSRSFLQASERRRAFSAFLQERRANLDPRHFGIQTSRRRRVRGLTRSEIAALIAIGTSYYTWIEQGRPINVSDDILVRMASILELDDHERAYFFAVAKPRCDWPDLSTTVSAMVQGLLRAIEPLPAFVMNARWDIIASNEAMDLTLLGDAESTVDGVRNLLWMAFTELSRGSAIANWTRVAPRIAAAYRLAYGRYVMHPSFESLLEKLLAVSSDFSAAWHRQEVGAFFDIPVEIVRDGGVSHRFQFMTARMHGCADQELVIMLPAPGSDAEAWLPASSSTLGYCGAISHATSTIASTTIGSKRLPRSSANWSRALAGDIPGR